MSDRLDQLLTNIFQDEAALLDDETPFARVPSWDSLKHVELVLGIQDSFAVDLSADEISQMTSKRTAREVLARRSAQ